MHVAKRSEGRRFRRTPASAGPAEATSRYAALIGRLAPDEDPSRVEAILRAEHGTLDSIGPVHFAREVKAAVAALRAPTHVPAGDGR